MEEVYKNIFIGNLQDCENNPSYSRIHACKDPCHKNAVGYDRHCANTHPNYLILEQEKDLYLNLVDMNSISPKFTHTIFKKAFDFIEKNHHKKILIHCNYGMSRSPSLGIFYLAKKAIIKNNTFEDALKEFLTLYSPCSLGNGFYDYLKSNWIELMEL